MPCRACGMGNSEVANPALGRPYPQAQRCRWLRVVSPRCRSRRGPHSRAVHSRSSSGGNKGGDSSPGPPSIYTGQVSSGDGSSPIPRTAAHAHPTRTERASHSPGAISRISSPRSRGCCTYCAHEKVRRIWNIAHCSRGGSSYKSDRTPTYARCADSLVDVLVSWQGLLSGRHDERECSLHRRRMEKNV